MTTTDLPPVPQAIADGDHTPGCGRPTCPCRDTTRPPCEEWMGVTGEGKFCPRCGWAYHLHEATPLAVWCADTDPLTGALCTRLRGHDGQHCPDGSDPWTDTAPTATPKD